MVTYEDDQQGYPHPDHLRVHEISVAAFDAAGDPRRFPEAGRAFQPLKLYYVGWSAPRIMAMHEKFLELGLESPFDEAWLERASKMAGPTPRPSTSRTTPTSGARPCWRTPPRSTRPRVLVRAASRGGARPSIPSTSTSSLAAWWARPGPTVVEDDLFAGVRDLAAR